MSKTLIFRDRRHSIALGIVALVGGSYLLYDAYERRGRHRPWALRVVPGP